MRFLKSKLVFVYFALGLAGCACFMVYSFVNRSNDIKIVDYYSPWWQLLNVHSSPRHKLKFGNLTFTDVRGVPPYYIRLPDIQAIMFVQGIEDTGISQIVLLYTNGEQIVFDDKYSKFHSNIGESSLSVLRYSKDEIVLKSKIDFADVIYFFDVTSKTFRTEYNKHGNSNE